MKFNKFIKYNNSYQQFYVSILLINIYNFKVKIIEFLY